MSLSSSPNKSPTKVTSSNFMNNFMSVWNNKITLQARSTKVKIKKREKEIKMLWEHDVTILINNLIYLRLEQES